ncbi:MAG: antitoxin YefM [Phenylobacterium sp.]|jgi:antitoxin YefM
MIQTTYTDANANLDALLDKVTLNQETAIISRENKEDVAIIPASTLNALIETVHLLRSPQDTKELTDALQKAREGQQVP